MAQIIKHRRGNLEGLASATTRAGELLVVTGSSGLGTITNGDSLVFVGIDGSTATPVNKILQGTTVPDLTGASYNTHVDGIPFYDTDDNKLYILNKGGNIEVKASPETGGTGIISGSSQLTSSYDTRYEQVGNGIVSGSSQVNFTELAGISSNIISASSDTSQVDMVISGGSISANLKGGVVSGSAQINGVSIINNTITIAGNSTALGGSVTFANIAKGTGTISGSSQVDGTAISNNTITIAGNSTALGGSITAATILEGTGVHSGSAQVVAALSNQATDFGTGRVSGDDFGDSAGTSTFTGSFEGDGSGLTGLATNLKISGSSGNDEVDLLTDALSIIGTADTIATTVTNNQVAIDIVDNPTLTGNVSITGNLNVQGTTTTIDSNTLNVGDNIINLNYGGSSVYAGLYANDVTAPSTVSGSILWDGTNDRWVAGQSGSEVNILLANGDGVVSGSSQISYVGLSNIPAGIVSGSSQVDGTSITNNSITISGTSVSLGGAITDEALFGGTSVVSGSGQVVLQDADKTGFTGASSITTLGTISTGVWNGTVIDKAYLDDEVLNTSLNSYTASNDTNQTAQNARLTSLESFTGSIDDSYVSQAELASATGALETADSALEARADNLESYTSSFASDTVTLTNKTINGSNNTITNIANSSLTNDGITIAGVDTDLGGTITYETIAGGTGTISGSSQVVSALSNQATDFGTGRVSADNIGNVAGDTTFTGSFSGDGSNLTGVASTLDISGSSGNGSVALKTQDLSILGTTNEIETSVSGQSVTIGLPDDVTIGNNLTVGGNLVVEGTTTTVDSTQVTIGDRILELNYARGAGDAGLLVTDVDGTTASGSLIWDSATDVWMGGALSSEKEFARLNASPTSNTVLKANASGLLVDSLITDDGTNVTIGGSAELRINAASANSFVYFDSNKSLEAVAASTAGDVIQWNGSSFVASNELDGGTF